MWGWLTAIVKGFADALFVWLREKEHDRLERHDAVATDHLGGSETARKKDQEVEAAARKVRSEPGPEVPKL